MSLPRIVFNISKNYLGARNQNNMCQLPCIKKQFCLQHKRSFSNNSQSFTLEDDIQKVLRQNFPLAEYIEVEDVSGGCGAMFEVSVISKEFKGLTVVKQHRLVNEALKNQIKDMHGLRIHTGLPTASS